MTSKQQSRSRLVLEGVGGETLTEDLHVYEDFADDEMVIVFEPDSSEQQYTRWLTLPAARALYDWLGATLKRNGEGDGE